MLFWCITTLSYGCSGDGGTEMVGEQNGIDSTNTIALSALSSVTTEFPGTDIERETINYVYDNMGRLESLTPQLSVQDEEDKFTTYLQYEGDLLASVDGPRQTSIYTIEMGRIVSRTTTNKSSGEARSTQYTYDESARLVQVTEGTFDFVRGCQPGPGAGNGNYSLTWEDNRVVGIVSDAGDLSVGYSYNDAGLLISRSVIRDCDDREAVERYSHDEAGRIVTIERDPGPTGTFETEERRYDKDGRVIGISIVDEKGEKSETNRHVYNDKGQLESLTTLVNGSIARILTFEYSSDICTEQLWTELENTIAPESETRNFRAAGMPKCAYFPSLR